MSLIYLVLSILMGALFPLQAGINSKLASYLSHPLQASFVSFVGGTLLIIVVILLTGVGFPSWTTLTKAPPHLWMGGVTGAIFVSATIVIAPQIGVVNLFLAVLVGQLAMASVFDHYQMFSFPHNPISMQRVLGILLCVVGVILANRS